MAAATAFAACSGGQTASPKDVDAVSQTSVVSKNFKFILCTAAIAIAGESLTAAEDPQFDENAVVVPGSSREDKVFLSGTRHS